MPTADRTFKTASQLLDHMLDLAYFHPDGDEPPAIPCHRVAGRDPLVVMVGDNASGKSFARRIINALTRENKPYTEYMGISMEGRNSDMGGIKGLIYGSEEWQSTGENSSGTVLVGITTCQSRTNDHVMVWDEPDLGLSDAWAAGMGVAIRDFASKPSKHTLGIFVITHSRALVTQLAGLDPTFLYFGDDDVPPNLAAWLTRPVVPRNLATLPDISHKRFLRIQEILDERKKERRGKK